MVLQLLFTSADTDSCSQSFQMPSKELDAREAIFPSGRILFAKVAEKPSKELATLQEKRLPPSPICAPV